MTKKDFKQFITESLKDMPLEKQIVMLNKIQKEFIPEIISSKTKNYTLCSNCKKYSLSKKFKNIMKKETKEGLIFKDAGYGDDDTYGTVECIVTYCVCPVCKSEREIKRVTLKILEEHDRYGNKII